MSLSSVEEFVVSAQDGDVSRGAELRGEVEDTACQNRLDGICEATYRRGSVVVGHTGTCRTVVYPGRERGTVVVVEVGVDEAFFAGFGECVSKVPESECPCGVGVYGYTDQAAGVVTKASYLVVSHLARGIDHIYFVLAVFEVVDENGFSVAEVF
jgi:hypothetical protein